MTLEYILKAAISSMIVGHHAPHCYRAHVAGKGYVNDGSENFSQADYLAQLKRTAESEAENMGYAQAYVDDGEKAYCFSHDFFDNLDQDGHVGKAPYPVYRVSDDTEVLP